MKYSIKKTLYKGLKYGLIFVVGAVIDKFILDFPALAGMEIGPYVLSGLLVMFLNYLKVKVGFSPTLFGKEIL